MAWAETDAAKSEMTIYQDALEKLDGPIKKRYCKTWKEAMGEGKG